jgi:hypothetical protein
VLRTFTINIAATTPTTTHTANAKRNGDVSTTRRSQC